MKTSENLQLLIIAMADVHCVKKTYFLPASLKFIWGNIQGKDPSNVENVEEASVRKSIWRLTWLFIPQRNHFLVPCVKQRLTRRFSCNCTWHFVLAPAQQLLSKISSQTVCSSGSLLIFQVRYSMLHIKQNSVRKRGGTKTITFKTC